jgi:hypothetical protein
MLVLATTSKLRDLVFFLIRTTPVHPISMAHHLIFEQYDAPCTITAVRPFACMLNESAMPSFSKAQHMARGDCRLKTPMAIYHPPVAATGAGPPKAGTLAALFSQSFPPEAAPLGCHIPPAFPEGSASPNPPPLPFSTSASSLMG